MRAWMMLLIAITLPGCLMEAVTVTAIQGEMAAQNIQAGNRAMGKANDTKNKIELESAINSFAGTRGHFPATLAELAPGYIAEVPTQANGMAWGYDPKTGKLSYRPLGSGTTEARPNLAMTPQDGENLFQLRKAIYTYWQMTGYYPESLSSLAPLYMQTMPSMASENPFLYDKQTGVVSHPGEFAHQQQLQVGSPTGAQSADGQARDVTGDHSDRQLKALNELGF